MFPVFVPQNSFGPIDPRLKLDFPEGSSPPTQPLLPSQILGPLDGTTGSLSWTGGFS